MTNVVPEGRRISAAAHLEHARKVADAVLYEGYLLYPYHHSARKNQSRFQFGVLMPPAYRAIDACEPSFSQTECLVECGDEAEVEVHVRFLQLRHRRVQAADPAGSAILRDVRALVVDDIEHTTWDEAMQREWLARASAGELLSADVGVPLHVPAGRHGEDLPDSAGRLTGRLVREWRALDGTVTLHAERVAWPYGPLKLRVGIENQTAPVPGAPVRDRASGLAYALIAAHALIRVAGGRFLSMTDPPEWAAAEIAGCVNVGTWPVLAGPPECHDLMLSAPVIVPDHAEVAPESAGDLFDATEIDELLTLRTLALTDAEKQAARATDPRAAGLMDRLEAMPPQALGRLHGAIRNRSRVPVAEQPVGGAGSARPGAPEPPGEPWWDPGSGAGESPHADQVVIDGVPVSRGSRIRMRPGARRADAQDLFLAGRVARVEAVLHDFDGNVHVAVSPEDDPAADLQARHGRFRYFAPDEIEPLRLAGAPARPARRRRERSSTLGR